MKIFYAGVIGLFAAALALGQAAPQKLEFEVASIRPSQQTGSDQVSAGLRMDGSQAHIGALSLEDLIRLAYRVQKKSDQRTGLDGVATIRYQREVARGRDDAADSGNDAGAAGGQVSAQTSS